MDTVAAIPGTVVYTTTEPGRSPVLSEPRQNQQRAEQVRDAIDWAYANTIQIITHANGEAALDQLIA